MLFDFFETRPLKQPPPLFRRTYFCVLKIEEDSPKRLKHPDVTEQHYLDVKLTDHSAINSHKNLLFPVHFNAINYY